MWNIAVWLEESIAVCSNTRSDAGLLIMKRHDCCASEMFVISVGLFACLIGYGAVIRGV